MSRECQAVGLDKGNGCQWGRVVAVTLCHAEGWAEAYLVQPSWDRLVAFLGAILKCKQTQGVGGDCWDHLRYPLG